MGPAEDLFEGKAVEMAAPVPRGAALYRQAEQSPATVKHLRGYEQFVAFCAGQGEQPEELAGDPARLFRFLHASSSYLQKDKALAAAAAVFIGNTLAGLRPDAGWTAYEGAAPMVGNRDRQFEVDRLLDALPTADEAAVQGLVDLVSGWAGEEPEQPATAHRPVFPAEGQPLYIRPPLPEVICYSAEGKPIPYGQQWGDEGPDPESYSVDSHPERFAALHLVARALIDHLAAAYDVDVDEDPVHAAELLMEIPEVLQAVKVTPRLAGAAPLTFVLTGYPGVVVHAGVLHDFPYPVCGCDACDETAGTAADRMERLVLSVAAGGYSERYPVGGRRWSEYALTAFDGSGAESGKGEPGRISEDRLHKAELQLRAVTGGWSPWPLRRGD